MTRSPGLADGLIAALILVAAPAGAAAPGPAPAPGHGLPGAGILPRGAPPAAKRVFMVRQSALCLSAIAETEARYRLPPGLMGAISRVETGRKMPVTGERQPWPWTVNADGEPLFFDTRAAAVAETARRLAGGARFVDIGCMQVDLRMHPRAFASLPEAFNPMMNTDYAARLLAGLHGGGASWTSVSGRYHSGTEVLAAPYRSHVAAMRGAQSRSLARALPGE